MHSARVHSTGDEWPTVLADSYMQFSMCSSEMYSWNSFLDSLEYRFAGASPFSAYLLTLYWRSLEFLKTFRTVWSRRVIHEKPNRKARRAIEFEANSVESSGCNASWKLDRKREGERERERELRDSWNIVQLWADREIGALVAWIVRCVWWYL